MEATDIESKAAKLVELLSKPVGAHRAPASPIPGTREVERSGDTLSVTIPEAGMEDAAAAVLTAEGLDPADWTVTGFRRSEWGSPAKTSTRYTFKRTLTSRHAGRAVTDAELDLVQNYQGPVIVAPGTPTTASTAIVCIADTQFGKEDDAAAVLDRTFAAIDKAVLRLANDYTKPERLVIAWMGDHVEGFVSQGGDNAWRTRLPLTEQIRLTRRTMIYAMQRFHQLGIPMAMVGVPGNHDQAVRFGKGLTTYDDSHDLEALLSVMDAAKLTEQYQDVQFFVPETDELSVSLALSGTHTVFNHGYFAKPMKFHDYAMRQANDSRSVYHGSKLVIYGHHHHLHVEQQGERMVIVCPAGETESTWFRHMSGIGGCPGVLMTWTANGETSRIEVIR